MNVLIDAGNSRIKWAIDSSDYWSTGASTRAEFGQLVKNSVGDGAEVKNAFISSTRNERYNQQLTLLIDDLFSVKADFIEPQRRDFGIINRYDPTSTLGPDRWAGLVAARSMSNAPAIIIDCGTAVTIDALNADGIFEGGVIFPGVQLSLESLNRADNLKIADQSYPNVFATTTDQAMFSGVMFSTAYAIDGIVVRMRKQLGYSVNVYLTGGDAINIQEHLSHNAIYEPDMVLKGLKIILDSAT